MNIIRVIAFGLGSVGLISAFYFLTPMMGGIIVAVSLLLCFPFLCLVEECIRRRP